MFSVLSSAAEAIPAVDGTRCKYRLVGVAKIAGIEGMAGVMAFEKVCNSMQEPCNGSGRGFLRREMFLRIIQKVRSVVETAFKVVN